MRYDLKCFESMNNSLNVIYPSNLQTSSEHSFLASGEVALCPTIQN
jgi:hypothetical protein